MAMIPPSPGLPGATALAGLLGAPQSGRFQAQLKKPPGSVLGIEVVLRQLSSGLGQGLVVDVISPNGAVEAWNRQQNHEAFRVRQGDFIIRVNNMEGDLPGMLGELKVCRDDVRMTLQHYVPRETTMMPSPPPPPAFGFGQRAGVAGAPPGTAGAYPGGAQNPPLGFGAQTRRAMPSPGVPPGQQANPKATSIAQRAPIQPMLPQGQAGSTPPGGLVGSLLEGTDTRNGLRFGVALSKPEGSRLGVDVLPTTVNNMTGLAVKRITKGGVVDAWNQTCRERFAIRPGDCIVSVNGISLELPHMMEELRSAPELRLTVLRKIMSVGPQTGVPPNQPQPTAPGPQSGGQPWTQQPAAATTPGLSQPPHHQGPTQIPFAPSQAPPPPPAGFGQTQPQKSAAPQAPPAGGPLQQWPTFGREIGQQGTEAPSQPPPPGGKLAEKKEAPKESTDKDQGKAEEAEKEEQEEQEGATTEAAADEEETQPEAPDGAAIPMPAAAAGKKEVAEDPSGEEAIAAAIADAVEQPGKSEAEEAASKEEAKDEKAAEGEDEEKVTWRQKRQQQKAAAEGEDEEKVPVPAMGGGASKSASAGPPPPGLAPPPAPTSSGSPSGRSPPPGPPPAMPPPPPPTEAKVEAKGEATEEKEAVGSECEKESFDSLPEDQS